MKMVSAIALVGSLLLAGCTSVGTPGTVTLGSAAATAPRASTSNEAFERQINPQRPRDCGGRYVVDPEDPCY